MMTINGNEYFLEKEISARYGFSVQWLRRARYQRKSARHYKLHGKIYYQENDVNEWLKKNMIEHE